jgi:hypothetical protein
MAQLNSPGVSVTVVDESFYTPAAPGTVPLIIVASQENKQNAAGTGTAPGTLKANAGKVYLLTSQLDLGTAFGIPYFETDASNNPVNASELNEYGLQAAYSFLGVSNRAYVVRADLDTAQLLPSADAPAGDPADGTYWLDTADTVFGVFQWDADSAESGGQTFSVQAVTVITDKNLLSNPNDLTSIPASSFGALGDYAIVATTNLNKLYLKKFQTNTAAGTWVEVGSTAWAASWPTAMGTIASPSSIQATDTLSINGNAVTMTGVSSLSALVTAINATTAVTGLGIHASSVNDVLNLYSTGVAITTSGSVLVKVGIAAGEFLAPALQISPHTQIPLFKATDHPLSQNGNASGSIWIKTTTVNQGAHWFIKKYNAATSSWVTQSTQLFSTPESALATLDTTGGGINLAAGAVYVKYNDDEGTPTEASFKAYYRANVGPTKVTTVPIGSSTLTAGTNTFTLAESVVGSANPNAPTTITFTAAGNQSDASTLASALTAALSNSKVSATLNSNKTITLSHNAGGEIRFVDGTNSPLAALFAGSPANIYPAPSGVSGSYVASNWSPTVVDDLGNTVGFAVASATAPVTDPADGRLWYNSMIDEIDIMIHDGTTWKGYHNGGIPALNGPALDPNGPIVSATEPKSQSDGSALANGDLWIDTSDLENFPMINRYNYATKKWETINNADQTTENGVVFHDARWSSDGADSTPASIQSLLTSNYLDPDAPDPALYPKGILLWNLRRSGFNVKKYVRNYIDTNDLNHRSGNELMSGYFPDRWVSEAANQLDGSGSFGRKAQREVVLTALNALIGSNQEIRQPDSRVFNLLSCPGYLETLKPLIGLNTDNGLSAFIVSDSPARLTPDATTLNNWGNNVNKAAVDGEQGLISTDPYAAVYYPWGYTTDLLGNNIVVPPSHMMLRTIALSDNVSYPWFAPAGTRRGGITNASSTGYVDGMTGEFTTVSLNVGQRDTLADVHVNPITYITGTGLVCYGQKTRQLSASSLDRINVARLVIYLRRQLDILAKPYVFEPNDTITRNEIKHQVESLLLELVGQRALYDYLVVCDTSNNTPARIDRNELHVDIAIEPVKAVEFIYIPLRLKNTGEIKGLGA